MMPGLKDRAEGQRTHSGPEVGSIAHLALHFSSRSAVSSSGSRLFPRFQGYPDWNNPLFSISDTR